MVTIVVKARLFIKRNIIYLEIHVATSAATGRILKKAVIKTFAKLIREHLC